MRKSASIEIGLKQSAERLAASFASHPQPECFFQTPQFLYNAIDMFPSLNWETVTPDELDQHLDALVSLNEEAYRWLLPKVLVWISANLSCVAESSFVQRFLDGIGGDAKKGDSLISIPEMKLTPEQYSSMISTIVMIQAASLDLNGGMRDIPLFFGEFAKLVLSLGPREI